MTDYSKQTWADGEPGGTPISAARLAHMEDGIDLAHVELDAHLIDEANAHAASAVSFAPASGVAATNLQGAVVELATDLTELDSDFTAHVVDGVDAHDASAISFSPTGVVPDTNVQDALETLAVGLVQSGNLSLANHSAMIRYRERLATVKTKPVDIVFIGDSWIEGFGANPDENRWIERAIKRLQNFHNAPGVGSRMYIPARHAGTAEVYEQRWTYTGGINLDQVDDPFADPIESANSYGLGERGARFTDLLHSMETVVEDTDRIWIFWTRRTTGTSFQVLIDGVVVDTIDTNGALLGGRVWDSGAITRDEHTIRIRPLASVGAPTPDCVIEGMMAFAGDGGTPVYQGPQVGQGIRGWDGGHGGYRAMDYQTGEWSRALRYIQPALVVLSLGGNDANKGRTTSQYDTELRAVIAKIRADSAPENPSICLVRYPKIEGATYDWDAFKDVQDQVASDLGLAIFDNERYIPQPVDTPTDFYVDTIHPTDAGHGVNASSFMVELHGGDLPEWRTDGDIITTPGPAGPEGPQGDVGPEGNPGPVGGTITTSAFLLPTGVIGPTTGPFQLPSGSPGGTKAQAMRSVDGGASYILHTVAVVLTDAIDVQFDPFTLQSVDNITGFAIVMQAWHDGNASNQVYTLSINPEDTVIGTFNVPRGEANSFDTNRQTYSVTTRLKSALAGGLDLRFSPSNTADQRISYIAAEVTFSAPTALPVVTSLPAASVALRGQMQTLKGATGATDTLYVCLRGADGNYSWVAVAP